MIKALADRNIIDIAAGSYHNVAYSFKGLFVWGKGD
jgi:hypothetical protein